MLPKLKKTNQSPAELETTKENVVEVVPQTQTETVASKLTKSNFNKPKSEIYESDNLKNSKNIILKNVLDHNDVKESNNEDVKMNSSMRKTCNVLLERNAKFKRHEPLGRVQKKSPASSKENTIQFISNSNEVSSCTLISQASVVIDKQLSAKERLKKIKCVYTILNNEQINMLRKHAQDAVKSNKIFTIRGNYNSVRHALKSRGWVEKLEMHRKPAVLTSSHINMCDLSQVLPKRKNGETQRQFAAKVERNVISRCIENMMCDFLWTPHKEKADHLEQSKNPNMLINKFSRAPFTNKENLNTLLRDIPAFYEDGVADIKFPRCFNVWSPEELSEFIDNFKLTACISYIHWLVIKYNGGGFDTVFSNSGKTPISSIDFAFKRCLEYIDVCQHNDIDLEDPPAPIWEHDWDSFLNQRHQMTHDGFKILADSHKLAETVITRGSHILETIQHYWPQHSIDGYRNLWIIKPANKCRGRGIHLSNNLKKILNFVSPSIVTKSHFVVQKYLERPLIIYQTKFDIRQWFLISSINPLTIWMYKECYLRFSTQEYTLSNHHESVHLTNHAIQKKYTNNGKRDTRLPTENMWDSYTFQAYLRQIGKQEMWLERIYPGMRKAIIAAVLVSQDQMERTSNSFELFGADFMICENLYPWLIEINSNPDLAATTSVTARMCPQCLEDVIKVMIDRRNDAKADVGNFELIYRQNIPPTPAYMGLSLVVKGKQITNRTNGHVYYLGHQRREKSQQASKVFKHRSSLPAGHVSEVHRPMPSFDATQYIEKYMIEMTPTSPHSKSVSSISGNIVKSTGSLTHIVPTHKRSKSFNNQTMGRGQAKMSCPKSTYCQLMYSTKKRHRSCGPRLLTNLLDAPTSTASKSIDNVKQLCSPSKTSLQCMAVKQNSRSNNFKAQLGCRLNGKSEKEDNKTNKIHAIGISICSWGNNKEHSCTKANV